MKTPTKLIEDIFNNTWSVKKKKIKSDLGVFDFLHIQKIHNKGKKYFIYTDASTFEKGDNFFSVSGSWFSICENEIVEIGIIFNSHIKRDVHPNNEMEAMVSQICLKTHGSDYYKDITLFTDSEYAINIFNNHYIALSNNKDFKIDNLPIICKVKSHSVDGYNHFADIIAKIYRDIQPEFNLKSWLKAIIQDIEKGRITIKDLETLCPDEYILYKKREMTLIEIKNLLDLNQCLNKIKNRGLSENNIGFINEKERTFLRKNKVFKGLRERKNLMDNGIVKSSPIESMLIMDIKTLPLHFQENFETNNFNDVEVFFNERDIENYQNIVCGISCYYQNNKTISVFTILNNAEVIAHGTLNSQNNEINSHQKFILDNIQEKYKDVNFLINNYNEINNNDKKYLINQEFNSKKYYFQHIQSIHKKIKKDMLLLVDKNVKKI